MEWLTVEEAARRARVTPDCVRKLCRAGRVRGAMKPGRDWLIPAGAQVAGVSDGKRGRPRKLKRIPKEVR